MSGVVIRDNFIEYGETRGIRIDNTNFSEAITHVAYSVDFASLQGFSATSRKRSGEGPRAARERLLSVGVR